MTSRPSIDSRFLFWVHHGRISYSKGSAVLKMLEHFMEPHNFRQGIRNFLKKFAFENAATPDLWASLQVS